MSKEIDVVVFKIFSRRAFGTATNKMARAFYSKMPPVRLTCIRDCLQSLYDLVEAKPIDIISRRIGGKYYSIVLDDEGLLKEDKTPTAIFLDTSEMLYGNLVIAGMPDDEGNMTSLTKEDLENIQSHIAVISQTIKIKNLEIECQNLSRVIMCDY